MSGGGSSGGRTTTVQKADPWSGIQPYLSNYYGQVGAFFNPQPAAPVPTPLAQSLAQAQPRRRLPLGIPMESNQGVSATRAFQSPAQQAAAIPPLQQQLPFLSPNISQIALNMPKYYQGQTVAGESAESRQAREMMQARAMAGSPLLRQGQQQLSSTMGGQFLTEAQNALLNSPFYQSIQDPLRMATSGGYLEQAMAALANDPNLQAASRYSSDVLGGNQMQAAQAAMQADPSLQAFNQYSGGVLGGDYLQQAMSALQNDPNYLAATDLARRTAAGEFVGQNPYLEATYSRATRPIMEQWQNIINPSIASQFAAGGRYGSPAQAFALERGAGQLQGGLTDLATDIYGGAYETERGRQQAAIDPLLQAGQLGMQTRALERGFQDTAAARMQAQAQFAAQQRLAQQGFMESAADRMLQQGGLGAQTRLAERGLQQQAFGTAQGYDQMAMAAREAERQRQQAAMLAAPQFAQADYYDMDRLAALGAGQEARQQALINADMQRWNYEQGLPLQALQTYGGLLQGGMGLPGTTTTTGREQGGGTNPLLGALGGASTVYGLGGSLGLGGLGGALGAVTPFGWGALGLGALAGSGLFG